MSGSDIRWRIFIRSVHCREKGIGAAMGEALEVILEDRCVTRTADLFREKAFEKSLFRLREANVEELP